MWADFERYTAAHIPTVADGLEILVLEKARATSQAASGLEPELSEEDATQLQHRHRQHF